MFQHDFICLNNGDPIRIELMNGFRQQSSPDISFATVDIAEKCNWKVTNETLESDHIILSMAFEYHSVCPFTQETLEMFAGTNAEKNWIFSEVLFVSNIQLDYNSFKDNVTLVAEKTIPWLKSCYDPTAKFRPKSYWL